MSSTRHCRESEVREECPHRYVASMLHLCCEDNPNHKFERQSKDEVLVNGY